mmetsp:Transcript_17953/g.40171  ORF Transcript_17953/g.40171 Transcript_17953/m.40171 type:complete len:104 (+) Transcript_17953:580-891(+)
MAHVKSDRSRASCPHHHALTQHATTRPAHAFYITNRAHTARQQTPATSSTMPTDDTPADATCVVLQHLGGAHGHPYGLKLHLRAVGNFLQTSTREQLTVDSLD